METDQTDSHRILRVSGLVALAGLLAVGVGGYLYYQNSGGTDVSAELQNPPSPGTADTTAAPAGAAPSASAQQVAADAGAPTPPPANQGNQTTSSSTAAGPASPPESSARPPVDAQSRPTSLSTGDFAYVQKSRANIRAEPRVGAKRVGQAEKGSKLNIVDRAGKWVQVDTGATKGWISGNLLGPRSP